MGRGTDRLANPRAAEPGSRAAGNAGISRPAGGAFPGRGETAGDSVSLAGFRATLLVPDCGPPLRKPALQGKSSKRLSVGERTVRAGRTKALRRTQVWQVPRCGWPLKTPRKEAVSPHVRFHSEEMPGTGKPRDGKQIRGRQGLGTEGAGRV